MSPFIFDEGWFFLYSILLGIGITFVYDCLRIIRRVIAHGIFWISMEDLTYWIFVSASVFYLLYYENDGAFRWFAILGVLAGMLLFQKTLSPLYVKYASRLLIWLKNRLAKLMRFLSGPFRRLGQAAQRKAFAGGRRLNRSLRLVKKRLTVWARIAKMEAGKKGKKNNPQK